MASPHLASGHISQESSSGKGRKSGSMKKKRGSLDHVALESAEQGAAGLQNAGGQGHSHSLPSLLFLFFVCHVILSYHRWVSSWDRELGCGQLWVVEI